MIKVISYGRKRRVGCRECGCTLEFEKEDVKTVQTGMNETERVIICPVCDSEIKVDWQMGN